MTKTATLTILTILLLTGCTYENNTTITNEPIFWPQDAGVAPPIRDPSPEGTTVTPFNSDGGTTPQPSEEVDAMAMDDGWSASGFLATGQVTAKTANGDRTQDSIELDAIFAKKPGSDVGVGYAPEVPQPGVGGSGAKYYTVQFGLNPPKSKIVNAEALITWKTQGRKITRRISVVNGAVISGTAQACNVKVTDTTDPALSTGEPYYVDILITPGARPSENQPPRLYAGHFQIVTLGPDVLVPIPTDAGALSVYITVGNPTDAIVPGNAYVFIESPTNILMQFDPVEFEGDFIPLPPGATQIRLTNQNTSSIALNYSVTFGIEG